MKQFLFIIMLVSVIFAERSISRFNQIPTNINRLIDDTIEVVGTGTYWTDIMWIPQGAEKTLLVRANDTSSAGIASDSAIVDIEMYQVFLDWEDHRVVRLLKSRSNPDSTAWPYSSDFVIANDLNVTAMDTAAEYDRTAYPKINANGDTTGWTFDLQIDSAKTVAAADKQGYAYYPIVPDASDGIVFKVTGQTGNRAAAGGSRWIFELHQVKGSPIKRND